jgi:hypothetical protein
LLLIVAMFAQFVLTSSLARPIYDPVGKLYGVFLFAVAGLTVLLRSASAHRALFVLILTFTVASAISRAWFLLGHPMERKPDQDSPRWLYGGRTEPQNRSLRPTLSD